MNPAKILIVEDEYIVAHDMAARLTDLGYIVTGLADTGAAAIALAKTTKPDLVLMDIRLKGEMDGIAAAQIIRQQYQRAVVFLTAFAEDATLQRAKAAEPYGYILKPCEDRELRTMIEIALYKHQSEKEISRLNRLYQTLSQINLALVRVKSREELFQTVCQITASFAGFKAVWVGWLDQETHAIKPLAKSGESQDYVAQIQVYADDRPEGQGPVGRCIRTGKPCLVNDFTHDPGTQPWHEQAVVFGLNTAAAFPIRFAGQVCGALTVYADENAIIREQEIALLEEAARDISFALDHLEQEAQRRRAEDALRESELRLNLSLHAAGMEVWDWDMRSGKLVWSPGLEALWGFLPGEFSGHHDSFKSRVHPEDLAGIQQAGQQAIENRTLFQYEYRVVWPDGSVHWVASHGRHSFDPHGQAVRMLGVVYDITQKKHADQQLRQLSRAVEQSPASIVITDTNGAIEYVNPKFTQTTGYTSAEVCGHNPRMLKSGDMPAEYYQHLWATILQGREWRGEFHNKHKDGRLYWEFASISPITNDKGKITHFVAVKEDITERKKLEAQLRQTQKLEAIGQLAGGVAHDFNNILAAIMMHLGLLQMNGLLDEETRLVLKDLDAEAKRAASLTRQLLMFSRRSVLAVQPLDLNEVVANLLKMLSRLIGEHINLRFDGKNALPMVEADAGMLEQVLMNLVVNARDAMPKGGRITISTTLAEMDITQAAVNPNRRPGLFVCLSVADTGCGMDAETKKRIFEPFFTTKEIGKGTGLGLATVHGIVAQHKGWVEVESAVGKGASFLVFLPSVDASSAVSEPIPIPEPLPSGRETILLVEDESNVRRLIGQALRSLGYQVLEAGNGQEAMTLWQRHGAQVALLLTDMVMPEGMTGLELAERLQTLKPGLKAIISSGYSTEMAQVGVPAKAGVVYLPKPYEVKVLADVVRNCLDWKM